MDSPKPLSLTTDGNPVTVILEVDMQNPTLPQRRIPVQDGNGFRIRTDNLILLDIPVAMEFAVNMRSREPKHKMAEHSPNAFPSLGRIFVGKQYQFLESAPPVRAPNAEKSAIRLCKALGHFSKRADAA
jgi:hypothetical protein